MLLRVLDAIGAVLLYGSLMLMALVIVFPLAFFVFGGPWWTSLLLSLALGLAACRLVRGVERNLHRELRRRLGEQSRDD